MRLSIYCILSIAGTLGVGRCAVDRIVAFGGALTSDERGTTYYAEFLNVTDVLPRSPYFDGRWSDGLPYIVHTAQLLGIPLEDYAVGGATTGATQGYAGASFGLARPIPVPSLLDQVVEYLQPTSAGDPASAGPLYVLEAGSDDYFNYLNQQLPTLNLQISPDIVQESLTNISLVIDTLASNGATNFLLVNVPPLQSAPAVSNASLGEQAAGVQAALARLVQAHNAGLQVIAAQYGAETLQVSTFDLHGAYEAIQLNGQVFNITDTAQACVVKGQECSDAQNHLWWDGVHPSAAVHELVGGLLASQLSI